MSDKTERTYIMVKPDGVQRGLTGEIIKRFEQKGFKMVAMKFMQVQLVFGCVSVSTTSIVDYVIVAKRGALE